MTTSSEQTGGGQSGTSAADTDPASGAGNSPAGASTVSYSGSSSLASSGGPAVFTVSAPGNGSGSAYSTTQATASPACHDDAGTGLVTNQACSART